MTVHHDEGAVTQRAVPGPALYFTSAMPAGAPKAMIGVVPGYADHGARYAHVMDFWAEHGLGSVAIDLRGHGRATGPRGYVARLDEYLDDVAELARLVGDRAKGARLRAERDRVAAVVAGARSFGPLLRTGARRPGGQEDRRSDRVAPRPAP